MNKKYNDFTFIFHSTKEYSDLIQTYIKKNDLNNCEVVSDEKIKFHILKKSAFAVSKSGTVSLEICNAKIPSISFNDPGIITCYANDFGFKNWISKTIELSLSKKDIVVLISSSGKSTNILNAAKCAKKKKIQTITLSGMSEKNKLKKMGLVNFWVESKSYNIIETAHQFFIMAVIDSIIGKSEYKAN